MARGHRGFAVLGHMTELGDEADRLHEEIGAAAAAAGLAGLIVVGDEAAPMLAGAKAVPSWHGELLSVPDAAAAVSARPGPGAGRRCGAGQGLAQHRPGMRGARPHR